MRVDHLRSLSGIFALLELDQNRSLAQSLGLDLSLADNVELLDRVNSYILKLSSEVTGLIVDPIYTFKFLATKAKAAGAVISLEQDKEVLPDSLPLLFPNFSLEEISNNYALAKLSLNYHPRETKSIEKKQLLSEIREYSRVLGIDVLLKLKIFDPQQLSTNTQMKVGEQTFDFANDQLSAIQEIRPLIDLLVIDSPADPLAMATIISELDIPCLVTASEKDNYEQFKEKFRITMENGAKGYCLGPVLWKEIATYRRDDQSLDLEKIEKYINTVVKDRLIELNRLAAESLATS